MALKTSPGEAKRPWAGAGVAPNTSPIRAYLCLSAAPVAAKREASQQRLDAATVGGAVARGAHALARIIRTEPPITSNIGLRVDL